MNRSSLLSNQAAGDTLLHREYFFDLSPASLNTRLLELGADHLYKLVGEDGDKERSRINFYTLACPFTPVQTISIVT